MTDGNGVHTVHRDGTWMNEVGGQRVGATFATRDEAVTAGRDLAEERRTEHHVHGLDGRIHEKHSHGNDPRDIPG